MIKITLPDGSIKEFEAAVTPLQVAQSISEGLARNTISALVNGTQTEVTTPITEDATVQLLPGTTIWVKSFLAFLRSPICSGNIGDVSPCSPHNRPPIQSGFYYDVDLVMILFLKRFCRNRKRMLDNAKKNSPFKMYPVSKAEALEMYKDNPYKTELVENLTDGEITFCSHDNFTDLCRGGHIPATGIVKAVKILNVSGAYWRGDEKTNS